MTIEQVLNQIYQEQGTSALNDYGLFKSALTAYYQPAFKADCKLMDQAAMVGMGNLVAQFVQIGRGPDATERMKLESQLSALSPLNPNEAARVVDLYGYMVGWYPLYQQASARAQNPAPYAAPATHQSAAASRAQTTTSANTKANGNGYGIASLILGVLSALIGFFSPYLLNAVGAVLGLIGIILGAVGMKKNPANKGIAIAGLVCSIIGFVICLMYMVACGSCAFFTNTVLNSFGF